MANWVLLNHRRKERRRERLGDRSRPFPQRWRRSNPISSLISLAATVVTVILLVGVLLTWAKANQNNDIVHDVLRAGTWLATPFHNVFKNSDARDRLIENWLLAAAVYLVAGRIIARVLRF